MSRILIVEDDRVLREELAALLEGAGYETCCITDFSNADTQMVEVGADLVLLDITLPGKNGEELLKHFRKYKDTPVIMLTSRTSEIDEVLSMSYGADDYVAKPYNPTILLLRISAVLKRSAKPSNVQTYKDIQVSSISGTLTRGDKEEVLTKNEMIIFGQLLDHRGEIVSRDALMTALWDNEEFVNENALFVTMSRLRGKLELMGYPDAIETRKKQGYVLR